MHDLQVLLEITCSEGGAGGKTVSVVPFGPGTTIGAIGSDGALL